MIPSLFLKHVLFALVLSMIPVSLILKEMMLSSNTMIQRVCLLPMPGKITANAKQANGKNIFVLDGSFRMRTLTKKGNHSSTNPQQAQVPRFISRKSSGECIKKRKKYPDSLFKKEKRRLRKRANMVSHLLQSVAFRILAVKRTILFRKMQSRS